MKKSKSIVDISKDLNLSIATISYIVNGKGEEKRISKNVILKVRDYIEEVGYRPSKLGKNLRTGKTFTIGLIIENISDPFFSNIAAVIETNLFEKGYNLITFSSKNNLTKTEKILAATIDLNVDGLIIAPNSKEEKLYQNILNRGIPLVFFDRFLENLKTCNIITNNYEGVFDACKHLLDNDFDNIGFVQIISDQNHIQFRKKAYFDFIGLNKLNSYLLEIPIERQLNLEDYDQEMEIWLNQNPQIDSIIFGNNYLTIKGYKALKSLKKLNLGIIGFDNHYVNDLMEPSITSISQPYEKIGEKIVSKVLEQIQSKVVKVQTNIIPTELIFGDSTRKKIII